MNLKEELKVLFGAAAPMINLVTYEEERVIRCITELPGKPGIYTWDLADGFQTVRPAGQPLPKKEVTTSTLLPFLADKMPPETVVILKDFHHAWTERRDYVTRKLRNMAPFLRLKKQCLVFVTPEFDLPTELRDDVVVVRVPLPDREELDRLFVETTRTLDRTKLPPHAVRDQLISSALGLTTNQARLAFSRVWVMYHAFDERGIDVVASAKREVTDNSTEPEVGPPGENKASST